MFKNLLGQVKGLLTSKEKEEAVKKLMEALNAAIADNSVTPEELQELTRLQKELGISESEMADAKIKIIDQLMEKVNADNQITEDELKMVNQIKEGLGVDTKVNLSTGPLVSKEDVMNGLNQMKGFLLKVKDKTLEVGTKVVHEAQDLINKKETPEVKTDAQIPPVTPEAPKL